MREPGRLRIAGRELLQMRDCVVVLALFGETSGFGENGIRRFIGLRRVVQGSGTGCVWAGNGTAPLTATARRMRTKLRCDMGKISEIALVLTPAAMFHVL